MVFPIWSPKGWQFSHTLDCFVERMPWILIANQIILLFLIIDFPWQYHYVVMICMVIRFNVLVLDMSGLLSMIKMYSWCFVEVHENYHDKVIFLEREMIFVHHNVIFCKIIITIWIIQKKKSYANVDLVICLSW